MYVGRQLTVSENAEVCVCVLRYRRVSSLRIEGLELWQVFPPTSIAPDPQPVLVIKRQVAMQRITT